MFASDGAQEWSYALIDSGASFSVQDSFVLVYPTDYTVCTVLQNGQKHKLSKLEK